MVCFLNLPVFRWILLMILMGKSPVLVIGERLGMVFSDLETTGRRASIRHQQVHCYSYI
jgi:hypothetical protein